MSASTPPNSALAELLTVLGRSNTREVVRTFLSEAPLLVKSLSACNRSEQHRAVHSLKSSARLIGAETVAVHAAMLEGRLAQPGGEISPAEISALAADLAAAFPALRTFADA